MKKRLNQIDFTEALERARKGERVYATDLSGEKTITVRLFRCLAIGDAIQTNYIYMVVEEVAE